MRDRPDRTASAARRAIVAAVALGLGGGCAGDLELNAAAAADDAGVTCAGAACVRPGRCRAGQASAQFGSQTALPSVVGPSTRLPMTVVFNNCSGMYWDREGFSLVPVDPEEGAAWGVRRVALPSGVYEGSEVTIRFELVAPLATGHYPTRWAISRDRVELFQEHTPTQDVRVLAPADCALAGPAVRFRSQVAPPAFVGVGAPVRGSVTFSNCSTATLTRAEGWGLTSRSDPGDTWGAARFELPTDVPYGAEFTVDLDAVAPSQPGRYAWSWQVTRGDAAVGEASPLVQPVVLRPADCGNATTAARFIRQTTPPDTVDPHQGFNVEATFGNCSSTPWDASYRLDTALPDGARPWTAGPVSLPLPVGPGFAIDVPFRVQAPGAPGRYGYRFGITGPGGALDEAAPGSEVTVRCIPQCGDHNCGGDGCGGSCGGCPGGWSCDGAHCQAPDRPVCGELQWWNTYLTYAHISYGWYDTDLGVRANTRVQLRHTSRLIRTGVYAWGYMPEFVDLTTGLRFRLLHLRPQHQWATDVGREYPAGYVVGLSGGDTRDTGLPQYSTGQHLCVQTLQPYRAVFPAGTDACR
jgi:hypothetical protein